MTKHGRRSASTISPRSPSSRSAVAAALTAILAFATGGCSDDDADGEETSAESAATSPATTVASPTTPPTSAPPTTATTTVPTASVLATTTPATSAPATTPPDPGFDVATVVETLASDAFAGRNDGTDGWQMAQQYLAEQLAAIAQPAFTGASGLDGYVQSGSSRNIVGIIPGSELPDQYVVIGAHYDGHGDAAAGGDGCRVLDPADTICNGAADDATGVAAVLAVAHKVAESGPPRRSLLIAFWDREEDGLIGSADFLAAPVVPVEQMVVYLNFDIQGANLSPSLRGTTAMVGAETGGPALVDAAARATQSSTLQTLALSLVFGQGRSDHANFVGAGVPSVFFTDANNGCYHTTRDDIAAVDFAKLEQQIATAVALASDLLATDDAPTIVTNAPVATYDDAVSMLTVIRAGEADVGLLAPAEQIAYQQYLAELQRIVDDGEAAFDDTDVGTLLGGAATVVVALANTECDGYIVDNA